MVSALFMYLLENFQPLNFIQKFNEICLCVLVLVLLSVVTQIKVIFTILNLWRSCFLESLPYFSSPKYCSYGLIFRSILNQISFFFFFFFLRTFHLSTCQLINDSERDNFWNNSVRSSRLSPQWNNHNYWKVLK